MSFIPATIRRSASLDLTSTPVAYPKASAREDEGAAPPSPARAVRSGLPETGARREGEAASAPADASSGYRHPRVDAASLLGAREDGESRSPRAAAGRDDRSPPPAVAAAAPAQALTGGARGRWDSQAEAG